MAYTPINWQTGDTITAEKMNKMDNGWGVQYELVTYFDNSVTTEDAHNRTVVISPTGDFSTANEITVTLDNTTYNLTGFNDDGYWTWGAPYEDFSEYTFSIYFDSGTSTYSFVTQTAGTYALKIQTSGMTVETSTAFNMAVNSVPTTAGAVQCVSGVTRRSDISVNPSEGNLLYFWTSSYGCFLITRVGRPCTILPENANVTASFDPDTNIFIVRES